MRIEEVINLYDFLANCGLLGSIGVWLTLTFIIGTAALWGKDKLNIDPKTPRLKVFSVIAIIVLIIISVFNIEAIRRRNILQKANCIKSEFVMYGYKVASFSTMMIQAFTANVIHSAWKAY